VGPDGASASAGGNPVESRDGFENLSDSVVRLDVWETTFSEGAPRTEQGVGSGVIMDAEGHVLTNAHVVNPYAERILVTLASLERVPATLTGWDHWTDLAVVQLDLENLQARGLEFAHARFGESHRLKAGDTVYALGTPNGLTRTITRGIISNTRRYFEGTHVGRGYETGYFNTWLRTDAAINPGNSGGPLALPNGQVVGINTRSYLGANNLSFAVPSAIAKTVMEKLIAEGGITRSYVGLVPAPLRDLESVHDVEPGRGMLVGSVDPGSPAAKSGMQPGDIVLSIDGEPVDGRFPEQLPSIQNRIAQVPVGTQLTFRVKRGTEERTVQMQTEELLSRVGEEFAFAEWGLSVRKISRAIAREKQLGSEDGVVVLGVQPAFPADEANLRRGDIITRAGETAIESLADLKKVYAAYQESPGRLLLEVKRNHQIRLVVLKP